MWLGEGSFFAWLTEAWIAHNTKEYTMADRLASLGTTLGTTEATIDDTIVAAKAFTADPKVSARPHIPSVSATAVLGESAALPPDMKPCRGHDFNASNDIDSIMHSYLTTGFQATNLALAIQQVQQMRKWRLSDSPWNDGDDPALQPQSVRERIRAKIFFAYTSNQVSCGQREIIKFLVQHRMVDVIVTTAGAIEEDLIKCFQPTYMGDFRLSGRELRKQGINRIGNLLVPNHNYCEFEDWVSPIINRLHDEQDADAVRWAKEVANRDPSNTEFPEKLVWTPSKIIRRLGMEINHPDSVLHWAGKQYETTALGVAHV
jgi:deoxyhypusine synthase